MIRSFKDKETEKVFQGRFSKRIPPSIAEIALKKLMTIHAAGKLYDMTKSVRESSPGTAAGTSSVILLFYGSSFIMASQSSLLNMSPL